MGRSIAIIGGGIIGASVAYYLSALAKDIDIHLVESVSIAAAASGKAGGFLAHGRPWHSKNTESLAALSFQLHQELADAHDGVKRWGYRRVSTLQIDIDEDRRTKVVPDAGWVGAVSAFSKLGSEATTGQVHPFFLSEALVEIAQSRGVKIHIATAADIEFSPDSKQPIALVAKKGDGSEVSISATDIVFAAGPWTGTLAQKLLGKEAGAAGTIVPSDTSSSIVLRPDPSHTITNHMLFTDLSFGDRNCEPEVYPRADGTVYLCGAGGDDKLATIPERADQVKPPAEAIQRLKEAAEFVSPGTLANAEVVAEQCCFRPDSQTGLPVIGKVREGIWMASGHGFWGIQNGPGTGKCLAELILGLPTSADISELNPKPINDCA